MVKIDKGKTWIFINGLKVGIPKDVLMEDNLPKSYTKVVGRAQRGHEIEKIIFLDPINMFHQLRVMTYTTLGVVIWETIIMVITSKVAKTIKVRGASSLEVLREVRRVRGQEVRNNLGWKNH